MAARADIDLDAPGKRLGHVRVPWSSHESAYGWIPVPLGVIRGGPGPDVLLTAGNHGDEYEGQITLLKLLRDLQPEQVRGRLIILPRLNLPAAAAGRRTSPLDDGNLNRLFPGEAEGGPTEQIAHFVTNTLMPVTQASLDIHSGGSSLDYLPCMYLRVPAEDTLRQRQLAAAQAFGLPLALLVEKPQTHRSLSAAALAQGHVHIATEIGGGATTRPSSQRACDDGVRRFLHHLGVLEHAPAPAVVQRLMRVAGPAHHLDAPVRGLFEPAFELGQSVAKGELAGHIHFTEEPDRPPRNLHFERGGMVVCRRVNSLVAPGDCLVQLAEDC
ncbi:MAG: succinylglutamate desuccinylase/aspartoacylase family protein [Burkholderiaceae bacterium]